eukprot:103905-Pleurochrysis_carterae.AAC.1
MLEVLRGDDSDYLSDAKRRLARPRALARREAPQPPALKPSVMRPLPRSSGRPPPSAAHARRA